MSSIDCIFKTAPEGDNFFSVSAYQKGSESQLLASAIYFLDRGRNEKTATIAGFEVERPFRRKGVGKQLLREVIRSTKISGASEIYAEITPYDETTLDELREFYTKNGFNIEGFNSATMKI